MVALFPMEPELIDNVAEIEFGPVAAICTDCGAAAPIRIGKDAVVAPAGTEIVAGTETSEELLVSEMVCPCGPAAPARTAVPNAVPPAMAGFGLNAKLERL